MRRVFLSTLTLLAGSLASSAAKRKSAEIEEEADSLKRQQPSDFLGKELLGSIAGTPGRDHDHTQPEASGVSVFRRRMEDVVEKFEKHELTGRTTAVVSGSIVGYLGYLLHFDATGVRAEGGATFAVGPGYVMGKTLGRDAGLAQTFWIFDAKAAASENGAMGGCDDIASARADVILEYMDAPEHAAGRRALAEALGKAEISTKDATIQHMRRGRGLQGFFAARAFPQVDRGGSIFYLPPPQRTLDARDVDPALAPLAAAELPAHFRQVGSFQELAQGVLRETRAKLPNQPREWNEVWLGYPELEHLVGLGFYTRGPEWAPESSSERWEVGLWRKRVFGCAMDKHEEAAQCEVWGAGATATEAMLKEWSWRAELPADQFLSPGFPQASVRDFGEQRLKMAFFDWGGAAVDAARSKVRCPHLGTSMAAPPPEELVASWGRAELSPLDLPFLKRVPGYEDLGAGEHAEQRKALLATWSACFAPALLADI